MAFGALARLCVLALWLPADAQQPNVDRIIEAYKPYRKTEALFDGVRGWERWIHPPLLEAIRHGQLTGSRAKIDELLRVEVEGVYSFQIVNDDFCDTLLEELDSFFATGLPVHRPNSMNNYVSERPLPAQIRAS